MKCRKQQERLLTRQEVAWQILKCNLRTLDKYIKQGRLRAITLSSRAVRIPASSLERFLAECEEA